MAGYRERNEEGEQGGRHPSKFKAWGMLVLSMHPYIFWEKEIIDSEHTNLSLILRNCMKGRPNTSRIYINLGDGFQHFLAL